MKGFPTPLTLSEVEGGAASEKLSRKPNRQIRTLILA